MGCLEFGGGHFQFVANHENKTFPDSLHQTLNSLATDNWEPLMSYQAPGPGSNPGWLMRRVKG
jgi:hypothetical protein